MLITVLEVTALLAIIIVPLAGPAKKKKKTSLVNDTDVTNAHYAVDEDGNLAEIHSRKLSGHEH